MPDAHFDPADAACWIAHGRKPEHAALIAAAWRDHPDLPPTAPLDERRARSRARIAAMNPVNEQIRQASAREQEARNFAFTEGQLRLGRASSQDAAILAGRDRHGYGWLRSVDYAWGWTAAQAGWEYRPPGRDLLGVVPEGSTEAYAQGFADGGGRRDDLFDTARRQFAAAGRVSTPVQEIPVASRPLPSAWPQPADIHVPVAWERRLLILAASAIRHVGRPSSVIELLDDPIADEIRRTPGMRQARIVILSAEHGFINGHALYAGWSEAMTPGRAAQLAASSEARAQLTTLMEDREIEDVLAAAQGEYLTVIDAHASVLPLCRVMERTRNTPLQQRAHCRTWLARGRKAGENVGAGHIRWSKVIQGLTGKLGEFTARYGGKVAPRGHRILIEVAPGVAASGYVTATGVALAPEIIISNKAHIRVEMARALRSFAAATRLAMAA
ncbi:hypothetical protein QLH51_05720 [Sphingomonas sp. 2R-10]|uniref:hypothetical protein n=1 Tax=Sphingomonas sp. 2R-10 TaxID=3045148 RepID=UPI000F78561A|nr:hypothetical protein [Sphingomonas sp. 2R-10]MDJ0276295.1 hypothetical protein [Sphingomonas sp. 2R-10]